MELVIIYVTNKEARDLFADYPVDICAGTQLMFCYLGIFLYQIVEDTKSPPFYDSLIQIVE